LFGPEDKLAQQLKEQFKEYEYRVSLAMIPFHKERLDFIRRDRQKQEENRNQERPPTEDEKDFLRQ
jgi:hypothetical protein